MVALRSRLARRLSFQCRPTLEPLEGRLLMAGLDVPQLSSRAGAAATIYLDFDGHSQTSWGSFSNITSPAYDSDNNPTSFSAAELSAIQEIWSRVAEDFAPFNVNVTTAPPASFGHGQTLTVVVGGSWSDWYGTQANGVSFIGGFAGPDPNVAYVFSKSLGTGFPRLVADQVSHEAGHTFGLRHQSTWSGTLLQAEQSSGSGGWAPIMGATLFASRTTWFNGPTSVSPTSFQDDMAIIAGTANGFGYVADDYPDTLAIAAQLPITGSSVNLRGLIGQTGDQDVFKFTTAGGNLSFSLAVAAFGPNLDSVLELRDANGSVVTIANNTASGVFSSALTANVAAGTYYLTVRASGGYGNVGQYTLTGTVVPAVVTAPEVSVIVNDANLASGGSIDFGSTLVGASVTRTFTVQNLGNGVLTLSSLDGTSFPSGFSLQANLGDTTLTPGESTTFIVQLDALAAGSFAGTVHLLSDDADEGSFDIVLGGVVEQPVIPVPEIRVWAGPNELASGNTVSFGSSLVGMAVTRTFTIQNVGDGDLVLSPVDPSALPAGFSLVHGLATTTLHPTDLATFVVQFDAIALGAWSGTLHVLSNDADESIFDVHLSGAVTAPEIRVLSGSSELTSGDSFSFGSTPVGTPVTHTFTIQNAGDGDLVVSGVDANSLPAGFSLIAGFGTTTVVAGASIILSMQLDAAGAGSFGGTLHVQSSDADESSFDIVLSGVATSPEISVFVGSTELASGGAIDFGSTPVGTSVTRTVTVTNVGNSDLVLSPIDPTTLPSGFSLVSNLASTTLAAGQSTSFTLRLDATASGSHGGVVYVLSNDADEGSFALALQGVVENPPPATPEEKIIDNGADGFAATGKWHAQNSKGGFERDIQFANRAHKNDKTFATATWTFAGLAAGQYRVSVTSPSSPSYASDAPFSVFDGTVLLRTVLVNQKKATGHPKANLVQWQDLGTFSIQSGTFVVQLTNRANGKVVADAVRIERVATSDPTTPPPSTPQPDSNKHPDKGDGQKHDHGGSHKPKSQHLPASHSKAGPKELSYTKPSPNRVDPHWLDGLAADVARHHGSKPRK